MVKAVAEYDKLFLVWPLDDPRHGVPRSSLLIGSWSRRFPSSISFCADGHTTLFPIPVVVLHCSGMRPDTGSLRGLPLPSQGKGGGRVGNHADYLP